MPFIYDLHVDLRCIERYPAWALLLSYLLYGLLTPGVVYIVNFSLICSSVHAQQTLLLDSAPSLFKMHFRVLFTALLAISIAKSTPTALPVDSKSLVSDLFATPS